MKPTQAYAVGLLDEAREVVLHSGVRASESLERSHLPIESWDGFYGLKVIRPILDWSIEEVWAMHELHGVPRNPLYAAGCSRVGCLPCIMSRKAEIRLIASQFPDRIETMRFQEGWWPNSPNKNYHSFFARDKTPLRFRSKQITTKDGVEMLVPTIDDVVLWSRTGKRARSPQSSEQLFPEDKDLTCESSLGQCE